MKPPAQTPKAVSAKDGADLKNTLIRAHRRLFVELRTLREVCVAIKILDLKKVRTALGRRAENLRRFYLEKSLGTHRLIIGIKHFRIDTEDSSDFLLTERQRPMIEECLKLEIHLQLGNIDR